MLHTGSCVAYTVWGFATAHLVLCATLIIPPTHVCIILVLYGTYLFLVNAEGSFDHITVHTVAVTYTLSTHFPS
ncbi:hypothetical protein FKM82_000740 [Ascaphus truei]